MAMTPRANHPVGAAADPVFAALGDGTRRAIFGMVAAGPRSVSTLAQALGVSLTAVTQHLRVLQGCGLLHTRKEGRVRICEVDPRGLDVLDEWIALNRRMWDGRFDALDAVLREESGNGDGAG
jgi:DNA-binding transcriptional ArsR family regulator